MNHSTDDPSVVGMWEPIASRFQHLPVHVALLSTGKVLAFGGSGNDPHHEGDPFHAEVWDPTLEGDALEVGEDLPVDIFCCGHAFLADGRLLVAGGTRLYDRLRFGVGFPPFRGHAQAYAFDPESESWTRLPDMKRGRWYPTLLTLADGSVLAAAGLAQYFPWFFRRSIESYSPDVGWRTHRSAARWLPLYPRLHLVPRRDRSSGGVFYSGSFNTHYTYPFRLKSFPTALLGLSSLAWRALGPPRHPQREEGASILLPLMPPDYKPTVLLVGGGTFKGASVVPEAETIDLSVANPEWVELSAKMMHPRYYPYSVILPDRGVLVVGGRTGRGTHRMDMPMPPVEQGGVTGPPQDPDAIHEAELLEPDGSMWRLMAAMRRDRLYHSNALLLPDGRVMAVGSNPARGSNELTIETFKPPYLFRGDRPVIDQATTPIRYGGTCEITTQQAPDIDEVALIRPTATTHCVNPEQRYVGLLFEYAGGATLRAAVPADPCVAPPGYYMLFILHDGIPSTALFVKLSGEHPRG
jgi:hypothetical protein